IATLKHALPALKERAKTLVALVDGARFLFADRPLTPDDKAQKLLDAEARGRLGDLLPRLEAIADWSLPELEAAVRAYADDAGLKLGKIAQPLRAALTGRTASPGIFDVLWLLGRDEALGRIRDQAVA
ncbi:MAG: glutamate--tRNA ligase, partial [Hyphomicrobiales bacterium]|nr:glutamate--tRNA ligase [Hyphomicrobiales bacterium]